MQNLLELLSSNGAKSGHQSALKADIVNLTDSDVLLQAMGQKGWEPGSESTTRQPGESNQNEVVRPWPKSTVVRSLYRGRRDLTAVQ